MSCNLGGLWRARVFDCHKTELHHVLRVKISSNPDRVYVTINGLSGVVRSSKCCMTINIRFEGEERQYLECGILPASVQPVIQNYSIV